MSDTRWEEEAALEGLGLLEDSTALNRQAARNPAVATLVRDYAATAAALVHEIPHVDPPTELRQRIMEGTSARPAPVRATARSSEKIIPFSRWVLPYAIAACLMGLVMLQFMLIGKLDSRLTEEHLARVQLQQDDSMLQLRLADMKAMNNDFVNAKVMVAWDPMTHHGMITMQNLPPPPPGRDYQLWVLDPAAKAPMSAGLLTRHTRAQDFAVHPVHAMAPGFAISMEPTGGASSPTPGAILFAVAAAQ
jgi:anti-sigma-K factor RskA